MRTSTRDTVVLLGSMDSIFSLFLHKQIRFQLGNEFTDKCFRRIIYSGKCGIHTQNNLSVGLNFSGAILISHAISFIDRIDFFCY